MISSSSLLRPCTCPHRISRTLMTTKRQLTPGTRMTRTLATPERRQPRKNGLSLKGAPGIRWTRVAACDQGQCAAHSVNTGGAMAANKSVRAVRGPPNTQQPHAARVQLSGPPRPSRQRQSPFQRCLLCRTSVGCAPPRQPWKATCDLSAGASQQAMARSSQGTAAAMRARISGPPSRIRRTRRVDECTSGDNFCFCDLRFG